MRKTSPEITKDILVEIGLAKKTKSVKIMGRGELKSGVSISATQIHKIC